MLQYDDTAFYFFSISSLSCYLLPSLCSIVNRVYRAFFGLADSDIGAIPRTTVEECKVSEWRRSRKGMNALKSCSFLFHLTLTIFCMAALIFFVICLPNGDDVISSFDPYSILGIDPGADARTIGRAYRLLALKYHPDHNPNNPAATAMFELLVKAKEALLDPAAKKRWEESGHPDGKQSLEWGIGLPSFLVDMANRNVVLSAYLIVTCCVIPYGVWRYYSNSSKFGEKDIMCDSYSWYHHNLNEHTLVKSMPEIIAGSAEFRLRNMTKTAEEKDDVGQTMAMIKSQMQKPRYNHPLCVKGNVLLHAHLLRQTNHLSQKAKDDLKFMLKQSDRLIDAMISVSKQISVQTALQCIEFGQYIAQGLWVKDSELLQLPHFSSKEARHCAKGKGRVNSIQQYKELPEDKKKGMADFTDSKKEDVRTCLSLMPAISIETRVFVDDDEDDNVYEGDLCTIQVTMTRNNLKEGQAAGLVHAPHFPFPTKELWWFVLGSADGKIISIDKTSDTGRVVTHEIKVLAPPKGTHTFDLFVKSNAYIGLDKKCTVHLRTLDSSALPIYEAHPDDAKLDDEQTLFEQVLNANIDEDSDSDEDDSDDESEQKGAMSSDAGKRMEMRRARMEKEESNA